MFGGFGLYQGTIFFGLISGGRLYFKTNAQSREKYLLRGMEVFQPNDRQKLKNYFEVPADVIEDRMTLTEWAKEAAAIQ